MSELGCRRPACFDDNALTGCPECQHMPLQHDYQGEVAEGLGWCIICATREQLRLLREMGNQG